jgi:hypothetical protein
VAKPLDPRFGITPHAALGLTRGYIVAGALLAMAGIGCAFAGILGAVLPSIVIGGLLLGSGIVVRLSAGPVQIVNKATDAMARGRLGDAIELLDHVAETARLAYLRRVADEKRAIVALRRGELDVALRYVDAAVSRPLALFGRQQDRWRRASAVSLRALLRAATGDAAGARADIAATRETTEMHAESLGWAEVAEAVLLEQEGDHAGLRAHLRRRRRVLFEHTHPRERAIVRAFQRMLSAKATSIYRQGAARDPGREEEPALTDWVARIAPSAAPFVRTPAPSTPVRTTAPAPVPTPEARAAVRARLAGGPLAGGARSPVRVLFLWAVLIMGFLAVWQFLNPAPSAPPARSPVPVEAAPPELPLLEGVLFMLLFAGLFGALLLRAHRAGARLMAASVAVARDEEAAAEADLRKLAQNRAHMTAASAHLMLAGIADRRAELEAALAHCDQGLERLRNRTALASDALAPGLLAERAALLAAMGRSTEARAEIAECAAQFPSYASLASAALRVALLDAAHRGDVAGAAAVAAGITDEALGLREELLADLARAAVSLDEVGSTEVDRLREELRTDAISRRWIEVVAPEVLAAFGRAASQRDGHADAETEANDEAAREAEAIREAEASAPRRMLREP